MLKAEHIQTILGHRPPHIPQSIVKVLGRDGFTDFTDLRETPTPGDSARAVRKYVIEHGPCTARDVHEHTGVSMGSCERVCGLALKSGDFTVAEKKVTRFLRARLYLAKPGLKA